MLCPGAFNNHLRVDLRCLHCMIFDLSLRCLLFDDLTLGLALAGLPTYLVTILQTPFVDAACSR